MSKVIRAINAKSFIMKKLIVLFVLLTVSGCGSGSGSGYQLKDEAAVAAYLDGYWIGCTQEPAAKEFLNGETEIENGRYDIFGFKDQLSRHCHGLCADYKVYAPSPGGVPEYTYKKNPWGNPLQDETGDRGFRVYPQTENSKWWRIDFDYKPYNETSDSGYGSFYINISPIDKNSATFSWHYSDIDSSSSTLRGKFIRQ